MTCQIDECTNHAEHTRTETRNLDNDLNELFSFSLNVCTLHKEQDKQCPIGIVSY